MPDLTPMNRTEALLAGEDLEPTNRLEYFLKEAGSGGGAIPAPEAGDAGKVPVANDDGTASWQTPSGGGATRFEVFMSSETPDFTEINAAASDIYAACESGTAVFYFEARNTYYQAILNGWYYDDTTPEYAFLLTTIALDGTIATTPFTAATASAHPTASTN